MFPAALTLLLLLGTPDDPVGTGADDRPAPGESQPAYPIPGLAREDLAGIVPAALPLGERLVFRATVEWKGAHVLVGHFELAAWSDSASRKILHGRGKGERFGYELDQRIVSVLETNGIRPVSFHNTQRGSEHHTKKLIFEDDQIHYYKQTHCRKEQCKKEEHLISEVAWKGPIPWGTKKTHCYEKECKNPQHEIWFKRETHQVDEPFVDLLTAIYVARTATFDLGGDPLIIPVVNDDSRWFVIVQPLSRQKLKVEEGEYDSIELSLTPVSSDGDEKKRFKGLFGIHGTLRVWVDPLTGKPLLIKGTLPISILNLEARIELISSGDAGVVETRHAARAKRSTDFPREGSL